MNTELYFKTSITIKTNKTEAWNALIDPEMTKQYMFGCEPITTWNPGSSLIWRGAQDGVDYVVGQVVKFEPESVLSFTVFDPNSKYADIPDNYLTSCYVLEDKGGEIEINVTQGDFSKVEDGQKRFEDSNAGWDMALQGLKKLLES